MARKTAPDGPKLQIREKNGQYYAYTSTSHMVNGKKKTVNDYIGRYDPDTGVVTPKTPMKPRLEYRCIREEMDPSIDFSKIGTRSYGGIYLLDNIQHRIGLGFDLHRSFGMSAKAMMSCVMALAINPGLLINRIHLQQRLPLRAVRNEDIDGLGSHEHANEQHRKSEMCIDDFFERRIGRCGDLDG